MCGVHRWIQTCFKISCGECRRERDARVNYTVPRSKVRGSIRHRVHEIDTPLSVVSSVRAALPWHGKAAECRRDPLDREGVPQRRLCDRPATISSHGGIGQRCRPARTVVDDLVPRGKWTPAVYSGRPMQWSPHGKHIRQASGTRVAPSPQGRVLDAAVCVVKIVFCFPLFGSGCGWCAHGGERCPNDKCPPSSIVHLCLLFGSTSHPPPSCHHPHTISDPSTNKTEKSTRA